MVDVKEIYNKRLKSDRALVMFERFPGSDSKRTLPAGKPSPRIKSFIRRGSTGYYQLNDKDPASGEAKNLYVKQAEDVEIVDPSAPDDSGIGSGLFSGVFDWVGNTTRAGTKYAGFVGEGFKESVSGVKVGFEFLSKELRMLAMLIALILGFWLLIKLLTTVTD